MEGMCFVSLAVGDDVNDSRIMCRDVDMHGALEEKQPRPVFWLGMYALK